MEINRNNYGAFFLDYWESTLDHHGQQALSLFLDENPDLHDEFLDFRHVADSHLSAENGLVFPAKKSLKKMQVTAIGEINQFNWENFIIAALEKDLTPSQVKLYEEFVKLNPQIAGEIELFKKTYLKPDPGITFNLKGNLKHKAIPVWWSSPAVRWGLSIAALLLIAFSLFWNVIDFASHRNEKPFYVETPVQPGLDKEPVLKTIIEPDVHSLPDGQIEAEQPETREETAFSVQPTMGITGKAYEQPAINLRTDNALTALKGLSVSRTIPQPNFSSDDIRMRYEMTQVFDYLIIRDGLAFETNDEKGAADKLIAGIGNLISGRRQRQVESILNPMVSTVAEKSQGILTFAADVLPFYATKDEEGRKETYFALSDNFNIRLSRSRAGEP